MSRIVFMGTPEFAEPTLTVLIEEGYDVVGVVTQPDRPKGRKKIVAPTPVKELAQKHGIPVFQPEKLRDSQELEAIIRLQPDVIVTAAYGQILPKPILDAPKYGCINVHASLLPKYRGGAPIHRAIVAGEKETGITIMYMVKALDAGDILAQQKVEITDLDTAGSLYDRLSHIGADLLKEVLPQILKGELVAVPQDESLVTFAYNISREDEKINWDSPASDIRNHVRGLYPWPVAYTTWRGASFKIWQAEVVENKMSSGHAPGTVLAVDNEGIIVATSLGHINLKEVQPAGKKRILIEEFVRGGQMRVGERLGEE